MFEITMDGPGRNCLGTTMMAWLIEQLDQAGAAPVLLRGANKTFSAGLNLKELAGLDHAGMDRFLRTLERLILRLYHHPGPTVALVQGHAIAGGAVLARSCDVAIAADDPRTRIGLNEVALGLRFPPSALAGLTARIDRRHHSEVFLGAHLFTPTDAARVGLIDRVSASAEADARAELALRAQHPAQAYADTKADLWASATQVSAEVEAAFAETVLPAWTSPALKRRIQAVLGG